MSLPRISGRPRTVLPTPTKSIDKIGVRRDGQDYIAKTIHRLCILDDVPELETVSEIQGALTRWKHCFHTVQIAKLEDWLAAQ